MMLRNLTRAFGALIVGAAFAFAAPAFAQGANAGAKAPPKDAPISAPVPPNTAPVPGAKLKQTAPQVDAPSVQSPPAPAQGSTAVPGWNNPPKSWELASEKPQYASIPGRETNRLIQGEGRQWRALHNGTLTQAGGWIIVGALAVLLLIYVVHGPFRLHTPPTGRLIERFNAVERATHWTVAISFIFLGLSGIVMLFGKYIVLPWLGYAGFSWLTVISKNLHNFIGPLFIFGLVVMFLIFVKDNFWRSGDLNWILHFGGMWSGNEIPSWRFNGMEKLWFWVGAVILGATLAVTGLVLDFPNWNQGREAMQLANIIHLSAAMLFIGAGLAHAYMGIFTVGAYKAMRDGYVDEAWAMEHHRLWYEEVKAGKRPERIVPTGAQPATGD
jgi:formate dehydrogenase subunit gamma